MIAALSRASGEISPTACDLIKSAQIASLMIVDERDGALPIGVPTCTLQGARFTLIKLIEAQGFYRELAHCFEQVVADLEREGQLPT